MPATHPSLVQCMCTIDSIVILPTTDWALFCDLNIYDSLNAYIFWFWIHLLALLCDRLSSLIWQWKIHQRLKWICHTQLSVMSSARITKRFVHMNGKRFCIANKSVVAIANLLIDCWLLWVLLTLVRLVSCILVSLCFYAQSNSFSDGAMLDCSLPTKSLHILAMVHKATNFQWEHTRVWDAITMKSEKFSFFALLSSLGERGSEITTHVAMKMFKQQQWRQQGGKSQQLTNRLLL